jgi:UDP-N-acetylglucosamine 2-epimerase (non-hydrolysing)
MVVAGTRPEIIKMAPILRALNKYKVPATFVFCGQHYDYNMSTEFIEDLELQEPDYRWTVKACSQGCQTARILERMERLLMSVNNSQVLVEGDTNGVLATALATVKLGVPVAHVEAGLRSHDMRMAEEHNRRLTDHVSSLLFAPTEIAKKNLTNESVWGKIFVTGNTVIDAVIQHLPIAEKKSSIMKSIDSKLFALATVHRAENVDDMHVLENFMEVFASAPIPVVCPMHPRTKKRLKQSGIYSKVKKSENLKILPPLGYLDFLVLMRNCSIILTDSGGIQEEATAPSMRKTVLVMRLCTERPEAVTAGFAQVVGVDKKTILDKMKQALQNPRILPEVSPFGDGNAADKIAAIIVQENSG